MWRDLKDKSEWERKTAKEKEKCEEAMKGVAWSSWRPITTSDVETEMDKEKGEISHKRIKG